jgi:hypothetical protein
MVTDFSISLAALHTFLREAFNKEKALQLPSASVRFFYF